jgi:hypothetical protein
MVDEQAVRKLCDAADLDVGDERLALIAPQLSAWVEAANELSRKLAAPEHRVVQPITVFRHPPTERSEE